jgi:acyl carrier protein
MKTFQEKLTDLLNQHSIESGSNTPDFILAEYLQGCLRSFERATDARERWYGKGVAHELFATAKVTVFGGDAITPDIRSEIHGDIAPTLCGSHTDHDEPAVGGCVDHEDNGALLTEDLPVADQVEAAILEYLYDEAIIDSGTQIDEDAQLSEIGIDSLDLVHLFMAVEGQFGVAMSDSFTPKTYRELVDGVVASVEIIETSDRKIQ